MLGRGGPEIVEDEAVSGGSEGFADHDGCHQRDQRRHIRVLLPCGDAAHGSLPPLPCGPAQGTASRPRAPGPTDGRLGGMSGGSSSLPRAFNFFAWNGTAPLQVLRHPCLSRTLAPLRQNKGNRPSRAVRERRMSAKSKAARLKRWAGAIL
jgi:hypothetical protein